MKMMYMQTIKEQLLFIICIFLFAKIYTSLGVYNTYFW